ncbi:hypothetical protein [Methylobacterium sp. D54C]
MLGLRLFRSTTPRLPLPEATLKARPDEGSPGMGGSREASGKLRSLPLPSLSSATRDYALAVDSGYVDRLRPRDLAGLAGIMGPQIWAWQFARRLTGQPPWRAGRNASESFERSRALREMMLDLELWERAVAAHHAQQQRALLGGGEAPPPFGVPSEVLEAIEARREAVRERARRRQARAAGGGAAPLPQEGVHHPPFPTAKP